MNNIAPYRPIHLTNELKLSFPPDMPQQHWAEAHTYLVAVKRKAKALILESYEFGAAKYGQEVAGRVHEQAELALGFPKKAAKADVNGEGKAKGFVSIEGISQSFDIWNRTVAHLIPTWDRDRLKRALELLEPMEAQAKAIRARLGVQ